MFGFLNINKPKGMTSHDVVAMLRRALKIKQIGHTGTLDPMATGVLPVAIGKASRLIEYLQENKGYIADVQFGKVSDTFDTEGAVKDYSNKKAAKEQIKEALNNFRGKIEQIPPAHSAVHYKGKRLYELARQGIIPDDIPKRTVFVTKLELVEFDEESQSAKLEIHCSKGTYIRSIINDLGLTIGTGAVMSGLVRTKSGLFELENAISPDCITDKAEAEKYLINPIEVLSYKCYELTEIEYKKIQHGQSIATDDFEDNEYVCLTFNNELCAISQKQENSNILVTKKVFIS
ncbi:MAG: tRNA pseudouridine(55) synthase TruB [Opitutales bacterium]